MFIDKVRGWCTATGIQHARGIFLVLVQLRSDSDYKDVRAFARAVHLEQMSHWMMGSIKVYDADNKEYELTLSGAFGSDGLLFDLDDNEQKALFDCCVKVPKELVDIWREDTGHNGIDLKTAEAFAKWANENLVALRVAVSKRREKKSCRK